ncbi:bifunctional SNU66-SART1 family/HIND motif [Babesia duncani]|nr:bifunctional SNU66-SART1 family/HIND motif [Babesia duncani]
MGDDDLNFVSSASIEETNALRKRLGLKPLAVNDTNEYVYQAPKAEPKVPESGYSARDDLISGDGIVERISKGRKIAKNRFMPDDDHHEDSSDLISWAKKMSRINAKRLKEQDMTVNYSDDEEDAKPSKSDAQPPKQKLKVIHKIDDLNVDKGDGVILTLADVGVIEADEAGVADVDFLENVEVSAQERHLMKQRMIKEAKGEYVPYDVEEDELINGDYTDGKRNIWKRYDDVIDQKSGNRLNKIAKDGFYLNVDSNSEMAEKAPVQHEPEDTSIVLGTVQKRRFLENRKQKRVNWNKVFGESSSTQDNNDPDLDQPIPVERLKKNVNMDDESQESEAFYRQIARHRARVACTPKVEPSVKVSNVIDTGTPISGNDGFEITPTTEFCIAVNSNISNGLGEDGAQSTQASKHHKGLRVSSDSNRKNSVQEVSDGGDEDESEAYSEQPLSMGLSEALKLLREKGDVIATKTDDKDKLKDIGKDINLHYLDAYGRPMTPKEAFRQISWTFHGKGPGLNKQELKLKRLERERLVKADTVSNSITMKALTSHQQKEKNPYLVLYGNPTN